MNQLKNTIEPKHSDCIITIADSSTIEEIDANPTSYQIMTNAIKRSEEILRYLRN